METTLADEKKKYEEIMSRLDKYKSQKLATSSDDGDEAKLAKASSSRPVSGRYQASRRDGGTSLDEFGDEDFKLSTDERHSIPNVTHESTDNKYM
jgi:hypothetical protein